VSLYLEAHWICIYSIYSRSFHNSRCPSGRSYLLKAISRRDSLGGVTRVMGSRIFWGPGEKKPRRWLGGPILLRVNVPANLLDLGTQISCFFSWYYYFFGPPYSWVHSFLPSFLSSGFSEILANFERDYRQVKRSPLISEVSSCLFFFVRGKVNGGFEFSLMEYILLNRLIAAIYKYIYIVKSWGFWDKPTGLTRLSIANKTIDSLNIYISANYAIIRIYYLQ
jgi:hypothetical protein